MANDTSSFGGKDGLLIALLIITTLAAVAGGIYVTGAADDVIEFVMVKYFKAEAKAEEKALETAGVTAGEGFLKERLKKNPVVSNDELNQVSSGLGDEAKEEFGEGGLGKGISKAFD